MEKQADMIRHKILSADGNLSDQAVLRIIEDQVLENQIDMDLQTCREVILRIFAKIRSKLGMLQRYIEDESINEIMVNGRENFFYEDGMGIHRVEDVFDSTEELEEIIRNIAADVHREINEMNPILDARLKNGSRVNAVYKNVAVGGPVLTIRKFSKDRLTAADMVRRGTLTQQCADYLCAAVECGYNLFVSGGTSSGKTTFLNAISDFIPENERVIVIEDSTELQIGKYSQSGADGMSQRQLHGTGIGIHGHADSNQSAYAAGPDNRRRGEGKRGGRYASGNEYRPLWQYVHRPRQFGDRYASPSRGHVSDVRAYTHGCHKSADRGGNRLDDSYGKIS